ncbi:MAG: hypothetical protein ACE5GE_10655 [Phycisphaerae bacterium]
MRGRGRRKQIPQQSWSGEPTFARETLERRWYRRTEFVDALAPLVTATGRAEEPFHRWLPFKLAFSPELVRRFLSQHALAADQKQPAPLLDPFCGAGTFVIECARQGVPTRGIEASEALVYVARSTGADGWPDPPDLSDCPTWQDAAQRLTQPIHRCALICAVTRQHAGDGHLNKSAPPLLDVWSDVLQMMNDDLRQPLPIKPDVIPGDGRQLSDIPDASIRGILTSPPYLSRHDYTRVTRPAETVYRYWHLGRALHERRDDQIRAHPRAYARDWSGRPHPAVAEACEALLAVDQPKLAGVVRSYFEDLNQALAQCHRVLAPGAPFWMVIGGARFKDIYVPSDTILADLAETIGLTVHSIRVARRLTPGGRKLGSLPNVAPRESILVMHK